jgi:hypothetical protein
MKAVHVSSFNLCGMVCISGVQTCLRRVSLLWFKVRIGDGKKVGSVGYIGDVNAEEGTAKILLSMFGLLPTED